VTPLTLSRALGISEARARVWAVPLTEAMESHHIDTPRRQAAFLAQVGHESGRLKFTTELWGPTPAQKRYEGRADLGNTEPGDGFRFRGRGLLQVTGRANYAKASQRLCIDCVARPELLAEYKWAAMSAADFWHRNGLNAFADSGAFRDLTKKINGGLNGLSDRLALWATAKEALGA
jgi:putative chitinase